MLEQLAPLIYVTKSLLLITSFISLLSLMLLCLAKTGDGFESMFQINHLSHFLLTLELLPVMLDTAESCKDCRIVIVSSTAHKSGVFDTQNMNGEVSFSRLKFYSSSKLYNVMNNK